MFVNFFRPDERKVRHSGRSCSAQPERLGATGWRQRAGARRAGGGTAESHGETPCAACMPPSPAARRGVRAVVRVVRKTNSACTRVLPKIGETIWNLDARLGYLFRGARSRLRESYSVHSEKSTVRLTHRTLDTFDVADNCKDLRQRGWVVGLSAILAGRSAQRSLSVPPPHDQLARPSLLCSSPPNVPWRTCSLSRLRAGYG